MSLFGLTTIYSVKELWHSVSMSMEEYVKRSNQWLLHWGPEVLSWTFGEACKDSTLCVTKYLVTRARGRQWQYVPVHKNVRKQLVTDTVYAQLNRKAAVSLFALLTLEVKRMADCSRLCLFAVLTSHTEECKDVAALKRIIFKTQHHNGELIPCSSGRVALQSTIKLNKHSGLMVNDTNCALSTVLNS